ncbi:acyltransferase family protein [Adhaeribacter terreus]|uniref:Acyltransferase family protein n=1 Tax=Adhaeribacter terreus TaxID=529703 RepID=A0ABW0ECD3_9BACT
MPKVLQVSVVENAVIGNILKPTYFPGLSGLRAIAAATVLFVHVELYKMMNGFPNFWNDVAIVMAQRAVTFFFVLSGFLITYLLFQEHQKGEISIKKFYSRRVLRIWPLYFLFFLIGVFSVEIYDKYMLRTIFLYALFLPNLSLALGFGLPNAFMMWSVGVEEQFYLVWPWIMKIKEEFIGLSVAVVFAFALLRNGSQYISGYFGNPIIDQYLRHAAEFFEMTSLGAMAIGGLGAYCLFFRKEFVLRFLINSWSFLAAVIIICLLFYFAVKIPYFNTEVYSVLFIILIANIGMGKANLLLENKLCRFLGNISYGIYMYNLLVIKLCMHVYKDVLHLKFNTGFHHLLFSIVNFCATVLVAWLSYQLIEKRFLNLKARLQLQPAV